MNGNTGTDIKWLLLTVLRQVYWCQSGSGKKEIKYRKRKPKWKWKRTRQIMGKWWLKFSAIIRLNYGVNVGQDLWFLSCPLNAPNSCKRDPRICIRNGERTDCCSVTLKSILQFICINYLPTICMRCWPAWQIKNLKAWH